MTLEIQPGAATQTAEEIDMIVKHIKEEMEALDEVFKSSAPVMDLSWADELRSNWQTYFNNDIPETMSEMIASANNLKLAVEEFLKYSNEQ